MRNRKIPSRPGSVRRRPPRAYGPRVVEAVYSSLHAPPEGHKEAPSEPCSLKKFTTLHYRRRLKARA